MRKLLILLLLFPVFAFGQKNFFTPGVPPSSNPFGPTWRVKTAATDSLNDLYLSNGNKWYHILTAVQSQTIFGPFVKGLGTPADPIVLNFDSTATLINNFAVFRNANGDLVTSPVRYDQTGQRVFFNSIIPQTNIAPTSGNDLVNLTYFNAHVPGTITASEGLTKTGSDIHIGGFFTNDRIIDITGFNFDVQAGSSSDGPTLTLHDNGPKEASISIDNGSLGASGKTIQARILDTAIFIGIRDDIADTRTGISVNSTKMLFRDEQGLLGGLYQSNYTTNQRLNRLAIPSVNTVIALADSVKGTFAGVTSVSAGYGMNFTTITSTGAVKADSTVIRSVANSYSLAGMQTKLNNYVLKTYSLTGGNGINTIGDFSTGRTVSVDTSIIAPKNYVNNFLPRTSFTPTTTSWTTGVYNYQLRGVSKESTKEVTTTQTRPVMKLVSDTIAPGSGVTANTDWHLFDINLYMSQNMNNKSRGYPLEVALRFNDSNAADSLLRAVPMYSMINQTSPGVMTQGDNLRMLFQGSGPGGKATTLYGPHYETPVLSNGFTIGTVNAFTVENAVAGVTNYNGFVSNIAAGSGRVDFAGLGTAYGVHLGSFSFGKITTPAATVDIAGTLRVNTLAAGTPGTDSLITHDVTTGQAKRISGAYYQAASTAFTNPMTTAGDMIYQTTVPARLPAGTSVQVLHSGTIPSWSSVSLTADVSGLLPDVNISSATNWNTAYTNRITSLTVTGNSGAATLLSNVLNIPTYTLAGLGGFANPMTTNGDLITQAAGVPARVGIGSTGNPLTVIGGAPAYSNLVLTNPASAATFTIAAGKTFTMNNTLTVNATDGITMTTPTTSFTAARTDAGQTFTGANVFATISSTGGANNLVLTTATGTTNSSGAAFTFGGGPTANFREALGAGSGTAVATANATIANTILTGISYTNASGTHALIANTVFKNQNWVSNGASVTNSANAYFQGAMTGTVTGTNYDIWAIGLNRLDTIQTTQMKLNGSFGAVGQMPGINASGALQWYNAPYVLSTTTGINAKSTGTTALYTVPAGKTLVVTGYVVTVSAASAITVGPAIDIGDSITGAASIAANQAMNALTGTTNDFVFNITGMSHTVAAAGVVNLNLNTASTGTSQTIVIDLIGYLK